ncbi:hypothetical protein [Porcipelethomonas sp.]|uniref:hypothetical protein n=1 Tax=Porcipelethomonas sp. TaxID=2981675 RepID=UPI003EFA3AE4
MRKGKRLGFSIFILFLTIILIAVIICTAGVNYIFSSNTVSGQIFGKNIYVVDNSDMTPEIQKGSAVIADKDKIAVLIEGNVILFKQDKDYENVMRIVEVVHSTDSTVYRVAADNKPDEIIDVNKENVIAKCTTESHNLGKVITFLKSITGILVGMILPCFILLAMLILKIFSVRRINNEEEASMFDDPSLPDDDEESSESAEIGNPLFDPSIGVKPDMTFEQKKSSIYENFAKKPAAKKNIEQKLKTENAVEKFRAAVDEKPPAPVTRKPSLAPQSTDKSQKMAAIKAALNKQDNADNSEEPATEQDLSKTTSFKLPAKENTAEIKPINQTSVQQNPQENKPVKNNASKKQDNIHSIDDLIKALEEEKKKL